LSVLLKNHTFLNKKFNNSVKVLNDLKDKILCSLDFIQDSSIIIQNTPDNVLYPSKLSIPKTDINHKNNINMDKNRKRKSNNSLNNTPNSSSSD